MTTITTTAERLKGDTELVSVFNIALHEINKCFTLRLGNSMDWDALAYFYHEYTFFSFVYTNVWELNSRVQDVSALRM